MTELSIPRTMRAITVGADPGHTHRDHQRDGEVAAGPLLNGEFGAGEGAMAATHPLREAIARYNDAWNRHDGAAIVAMHTPDSVFCNHTFGGGEVIGREAIGALVEGVFRTFPDLHLTIRRQYLGADFVTQEWSATATHGAPVHYDGRVLLPTGRIIAWNGVDVLPFRDGLVARKDVYTDTLGFLRQLGAL